VDKRERITLSSKKILDIDTVVKENINATSMTDTYRYEITSSDSGYARMELLTSKFS
jgi:hypothetical protein